MKEIQESRHKAGINEAIISDMIFNDLRHTFSAKTLEIGTDKTEILLLKIFDIEFVNGIKVAPMALELTSES